MAFTKSQIIWAKGSTVIEKDVVAVVPKVEGKYEETVYYDDTHRPEETTQTSFNTLALDCVLQEGHVFRNEVTAYPVSSGFLISEHVIKKNPLFSLNGIITNISMPSDLSLISTAGKVVGSMVNRVVGPVLGSLIGSAAHAIDNTGLAGDPIKDAFLQLQKLVESGTIVHVATILGVYEGCVLREVRINQDGQTATVLPLVLTFERLQVIQPDGRIGFEVPADQKRALQTTTPSDAQLMLKALKAGGVNILGSFL